MSAAMIITATSLAIIVTSFQFAATVALEPELGASIGPKLKELSS